MGDLFELLWWLAEVTKTGQPDNGYLDGLPSYLWPHLIAIGEYIVELMGWT